MGRQTITGIVGAGLVAAIPALLHSCDDMLRAMAPTARREVPEFVHQAERVAVREEVEAAAAAAEKARRGGHQAAAQVEHALPSSTVLEHSQSGSKDRKTLQAALNPAVHASLNKGDSWRPFAGETIEFVSTLGTAPPTSTAVSRPYLLAAFPVNEEAYRHVYRKAPTAAAESEFASLSKRLTTSSSKHHQTELNSSSNLRSALGELHDADLVVIIAHSEDLGDTIVLSSGQRLSFVEVHLTCGEVRIRCVVLSCYSPDVQLTSEVSTADALRMWSVAMKAWSASPASTDADQFVRSLRRARTDLQYRRQVLLTAAVVTPVAVGASGYELVKSRQR